MLVKSLGLSIRFIWGAGTCCICRNSNLNCRYITYLHISYKFQKLSVLYWYSASEGDFSATFP